VDFFSGKKVFRGQVQTKRAAYRRLFLWEKTLELDTFSVMKFLIQFCALMSIAWFLAFVWAIFADTSKGENPYTVWQALLMWVLFTVAYRILRWRR
jgi:hypothetical protein